MELTYRPRRLRRTPALRAMVREHSLSAADFIYPLFVHEGDGVEPIAAMPGASRWSLSALMGEVQRAWDLGVRCIVLFPKVSEELKTEDGAECFNENGLIPRAIRQIKAAIPQMAIMTDVALDPYSCDGHDGIVSEHGVVLNDETIEQLCKQAVVQARAGADLIGPSDMMDGRVGAIRAALDSEGFENVRIMSYAAKYASSLYSPFRDAVGSTTNLNGANKNTYQMDPANSDEALREVALDIEEGADMLMVKPGLFYLDILQRIKETFAMPTFAYQVSGEYAMLKVAGQQGLVDGEQTLREALLAFKRAGANGILTYAALETAKKLAN